MTGPAVPSPLAGATSTGPASDGGSAVPAHRQHLIRDEAGHGDPAPAVITAEQFHRPSGGLRLRLFQMFRKPVHALAWRLRLVEYALSALEREIKSTVRVPRRVMPRLWWRGLLSEAWVLYDLARNDPEPYLSDIERFVGTRLINGAHGVVLDDKLLLARLFDGPLARYAPPVFGVLSNGRVAPVRPGGETFDLLELLEREGTLAVKPSSGGGGHGFSFLERRDDGTLWRNWNPVSADALARLATENAGYMVTGYVRQHPELAALYRRTTNTMRIVTMHDEQTEPFIAAAVLRIGTSVSEPTDNWPEGSICAAIDVESGRLGRAVAFPANADRLSWFARHPDTGTPIEGATVPGWSTVEREIRAIAGAFPFLRYVGWDVVVTEDGFRILEGNNYSGVAFLQVHRPLLADPRVRAFFRRHGVLKRRRGT